jgi:hypothetical protein
MALSCDGSILFVAYNNAKCVIAWYTATLQIKWKAEMMNFANSVSVHDDTVLVGVSHSEFSVLDATDGHVLRTFSKAKSFVLGHSVLSGEGRWLVNFC